MTAKPLQKALRLSAALTLGVLTIAVFNSSRADANPTAAGSASIGVQVDQPTTTVPPTTQPPTTSAPVATTTPAPTTTPPTTSPATTVVPTTLATIPFTSDTLPDVLPMPVSVTPSHSSGFVAQVRSAGRATRDLVSGIVSGKPVADVAQAVLPQSVATVVVPAVRTASTFVFPIGLAAAVIAFLALQARIDSGDPKLSAAPLAHDDDFVEFA